MPLLPRLTRRAALAMAIGLSVAVPSLLQPTMARAEATEVSYDLTARSI